MLTIVIAAEMGGQEWGNAVHEGGPMGIWSLLPYIPVFVGLFTIGHWLKEERFIEADQPAPGVHSTVLPSTKESFQPRPA